MFILVSNLHYSSCIIKKKSRNMIKTAIVEDLKEIQRLLLDAISKDNDIVCIGVYDNAEDFMEALPNIQPDVVLMDIGLPQMNGSACVKLVKPLYPNIEYMMCTIFEEDEQVFNALAAGANAYMLKSAPFEDIIAAIKDLKNGGSPMSSSIARKVLNRLKVPANVSYQSTANADEILSKRELEILNLLAKGYLYKEICDQLFISFGTIKAHVYHIYKKMQVNNKTEAINKFFGN